MLSFTGESENLCGTRGPFCGTHVSTAGGGGVSESRDWLVMPEMGSNCEVADEAWFCSAFWFLIGHGPRNPWSKKHLTTTKLLSLDDFWNKGKGYILDNVRSRLTRGPSLVVPPNGNNDFLTDQVMS